MQQMHLGLSGVEWKALAAEVTDVWHLAGRTGLRVPRPSMRRINVEGTRNVLELCQAAPPAPSASTTSPPPTSPATGWA